MSCLKREDGQSCTYSSAERLGRERSDYGDRDSEAQLRLQKLEEMVTSLIQTNKEGSESRSDKVSSHSGMGDQDRDDVSDYRSPQPSVSSMRTHLSINGTEKEYVNNTHWTAILENVSCPHARRKVPCLADLCRSETSKVF